ncbi:MAG: hypothetical protein GXP47_10935 [Acidobacteria bacterium]|nr:hypothetical protein [Acidobacteriota bacterium]
MRKRQDGAAWGAPGLAGYGLLVLLTAMAAFWGTAELFHEGWFAPYGKYLVFYMLPMLLLMGLTLLALASPAAGGALIVGGAVAFTIWRYLRLRAIQAPIVHSLWIMGLVLALPGILLLLESWRQRRSGGAAASGPGSPWPRRRQITAVALPLAIALAVGIPSLVRVLHRIPLRDHGPVTIHGNGVTLTFAGEGPGWLYSNRHPIVFEGTSYTGLSWNEIALFGKEPVGFEGKRRAGGDGTQEPVRNASQEEFDRYNMFRYIDPSGARLTRQIHDTWRLPSAAELVAVLTRHGANAGGRLDPRTGAARYATTPDKEAPLWDPAMEVIYYWTATSADPGHALDISYSGRVRPVLKSSAQDYRGFRAVRVERAHPGAQTSSEPEAGENRGGTAPDEPPDRG